MSAPSAGAETSTRLAPAVRCIEALSFEVKMPVHSSAMSTPRSFHGSVAGSLMAVTLMAPLPTLMVSPLTVTVPGKRPCTESKRSRWALVSTGPRSLMPTTSMSVRPDSAMARSTLRPIRPNPLMATRTVIFRSHVSMWSRPARASAPEIRREWPGVKPGHDEENLRLAVLLSPFAQFAQRGFRDPRGRYTEMAIELLVGPAGAEAGHANEGAVGADDGVPSHPHGGLDADLDRRIADHRAAGLVRLCQEQFDARHRDDAGGDALFGQRLLRLDRDGNLGAGGEQRHLRRAFRRRDFVGAGNAKIAFFSRGAKLRQVLPRQRYHARR